MQVQKNKASLLLLDKSVFLRYFAFSKKDQLLLKLFWLGFIIYTVAFVLQPNFNWIICQSFQLLGLTIMIPGIFTQLRFKFDSLYLQVLFVPYFLWLMLVIVRGIALDYELIKMLIFDAWFGGLLYFAPLAVFFPKNLFFYKKLFEVIFVLSLVFLGLTLLFATKIFLTGQEDMESRGIVEAFVRTLAFPVTFILFTFSYHFKKRKLLAALVILLAILFAIVKARRGLLFMTTFPLIISYMLYLYKSKSKMLVFVMSALLCLIISVFAISFFQQSNLFNSIKERGLEDTRSLVEECFYDDFQTTDWIIGRGLRGQYFCPGIDEFERTGYRSVIETDYLQIILKGGLISLVFLLLITIPAIFLGLFASKNLLSKAAAVWILLALIYMYPSTINTFTFNYLLVWISVGICYSKFIRNMSDEVLKLYFNPQKS